MNRNALSTLAIFLALAGPTQAQEWVFGLSGWDTKAGDKAALTVEVHGKPRWDYGWVKLGLGGGVGVDEDGSAWIGGGVVAEAPLSQHWFVKASVMPGYFHADTPTVDLGSDFEVRSVLGLGYRFDSGDALSLAVGHLSNAGIGDRNPGTNGVLLRYHRRF